MEDKEERGELILGGNWVCVEASKADLDKPSAKWRYWRVGSSAATGIRTPVTTGLPGDESPPGRVRLRMNMGSSAAPIRLRVKACSRYCQRLLQKGIKYGIIVYMIHTLAYLSPHYWSSQLPSGRHHSEAVPYMEAQPPGSQRRHGLPDYWDTGVHSPELGSQAAGDSREYVGRGAMGGRRSHVGFDVPVQSRGTWGSTLAPLPFPEGNPLYLEVPTKPLTALPHVMIYNRVGKTGSSGVINVIRSLAKILDYHLVSSRIFAIRRMDRLGQRELAREISEMPTPLVFERHFHFFNHSQFGYEDPVYINVVREPLERLVSAYYFRRANVHNKHNLRSELNKQMPYDDCVRLRMMCTDNRTTFRVIPFFCGQHDFCQEPTYDSLNQAKANVERFYPLVGITDDLDSFFMVAEKLMPFYFKGAAEIFRFQQDALHRRFGTREKRPMSNDTIAYMKPRLTLEYDFYNWLVQRFEQQKAAFLS